MLNSPDVVFGMRIVGVPIADPGAVGLRINEVLANNGSIEAARIALFMHRHGVQLYGSDWAATDEDLELWSKMTGTRPPNEPDRVVSTAPKPAPWKARMYNFVGRSAEK